MLRNISILVFALLSAPLAQACDTNLTAQQLTAIGQQIYKNECNQQRQCLVDWNQGESFPSLGIGHFIWYPDGINEGFIESFPLLIEFFQSKNITLPHWLTKRHPFTAPWPTRQAFLLEKDQPQAESMRAFLEANMATQTEFMLQRMQNSLTDILDHSKPEHRQTLKQRINALCQSQNGIYALVDYVNFKGEGLASSETYNGQGWGLKQVLEAMQGNDPKAFASAAEAILTRRANNASNPMEREKWLPGWKKRLQTYSSFTLPD